MNRLAPLTSGILALFLLLSGCVSQQPRAASVAIGDEVTLRAGESVTVQPRNVVLQFAEVVADSRCPADATCVWEGDAEVSIRAVAADGTSADLRVHTRDPKEATFAGLTIRLVGLAPVPLQGKPPLQADYEATLSIGG